MSEKTVITALETRDKFFELLKVNPGLIVLKFGATWCGPCRKISHIVDAFFATSPPEVLCAEIDVDECHDLYSFLKSKKMINGIPTMMCFRKDNVSYIPNESVLGIAPNDLHTFFKKCGHHLAEMKKIPEQRIPSLHS